MNELVHAFLHVDQQLAELTASYGGWIYAVLFIIVFCETGLVVTPFLPGDSLLFAAGTLAAVGSLDVWVLAALLITAAILGDTANYHIGKYLGPQVLRREKSRWLNPQHLARTHRFFEKYGPRTIILARFVPIVRTFAPFLAGVGTMAYSQFILYNVLGGVIWVVAFLGAGYWFGNVPVVREHFTLVVLAIIVISVLPLLVEFIRARAQTKPRQEVD